MVSTTESVTAHRAAPPCTTLDIEGVNLDNGATLAVAIAGAAMSIGASSGTGILASISPPLAPGSYLLTVETGGARTQFDAAAVAVGAVGPAGPAGPSGGAASFVSTDDHNLDRMTGTIPGAYQGRVGEIFLGDFPALRARLIQVSGPDPSLDDVLAFVTRFEVRVATYVDEVATAFSGHRFARVLGPPVGSTLDGDPADRFRVPVSNSSDLDGAIEDVDDTFKLVHLTAYHDPSGGPGNGVGGVPRTVDLNFDLATGTIPEAYLGRVRVLSLDDLPALKARVLQMLGPSPTAAQIAAFVPHLEVRVETFLDAAATSFTGIRFARVEGPAAELPDGRIAWPLVISDDLNGNSEDVADTYKRISVTAFHSN